MEREFEDLVHRRTSVGNGRGSRPGSRLGRSSDWRNPRRNLEGGPRHRDNSSFSGNWRGNFGDDFSQSGNSERNYSRNPRRNLEDNSRQRDNSVGSFSGNPRGNFGDDFSQSGNSERNYSRNRRRNLEDNSRQRDNSVESFSGNPRTNYSRRPNSGVNRNSGDGGNNNGGPRYLGFKRLEEIFAKSPDDIVIELARATNNFYNLLEKDNMTSDLIVLLVQIFSKVTESICVENKNRLIKMSTSSFFISKLKIYISGLHIQEEEERKKNSYFWKHPDTFFANLYILFKSIYETMYSTAMDVLPSVLKAAVFSINALQEDGVSIEGEISSNFRNLKTILENEQKENGPAVKDKRKSVRRRIVQRPNDFREMTIYPLTHELCDPNYKPFIQENVITGNYENVEDYLDIHFRLLREDFVTPLRNGILEYIFPNEEKKNRNQDIRIYKQVTCVDIIMTKSSSGYVFDLGMKKNVMKNLVHSKRFLHGSLVCFTRDNFKTIIYGSISDRNEDLLSKGQILVNVQDTDVVNIGETFVMAENKIYFVPYYYVLKSLQCIDLTNSRMQKYLVDVDVSGHPPDYIEVPPPKNLLMTAKMMNLNESQTLAFSAAISNEFVVIQGPPGTGKTFLGLKVAKELLKIVNGPMLVISFTNHALDQFLEGLIGSTQEIVRVGGQSKNSALEEFNLKSLRNRKSNSRYNNLISELKTLEAEISSLNIHRIQLENKQTLIMELMNMDLVLFSEMDLLKFLFNDKHIPNYALGFYLDLFSMLDDIFDDIQIEAQEDIEAEMKIENIIFTPEECDNRTLPRLERNIFYAEKILQCLNPTGKFHLFLQINILKCKEIYQTLQKRLGDIDFTTPLEQLNINLSEETPVHLRWRYYEHLLKKDYEATAEKIRHKLGSYWGMKTAVDEISNYDDCEIMKNAKVIGMTTTSAARLQSIIGLIRAPLVIIEEAAEILEAHLIGVLGESCKHAILIGDHQQLRPSTNDYCLDVKYKLGISLFERMIMNNIQCTTLSIQHRMRPEISNLVCPSIYPNLKNAQNVYNYPNVKGVAKNVFFLTHQNPELGEMDSKVNEFEAKYLILLAKYLIAAGHPPESITILCTYFGQFLEMRKISKTYPSLQSVRISILDNYQGEENDIILLSLVRNNKEGKIGFLKIENRICVALSRAKHGLYILGNMDMLSKQSKIWEQVKDVLEKMDSLGEALPLYCQKHIITTNIKTIRDFDGVAEGGCTLPCGEVLPCYHVCLRICHMFSHEKLNCMQPCRKTLCELEHMCPKLCSQTCEKCMVPKTTTLACGHTLNIPCHKKPEDILCFVKVVKKLPCEHNMEVLCSDNPTSVKCCFPCEYRIESCGHACERTCHINDDPDHLNYKCQKPCERNMDGCTRPDEKQHKCQLRCHMKCTPCTQMIIKPRSKCEHFYNIECHKDPNDIVCIKKCKKKLLCGHPCKLACKENCILSSCTEKVTKVIEECGHKINIDCHKTPSISMCKKNCVKILACGHPCTLRCKEPCDSKLCEHEIQMKTILPCNHQTEYLPCSLKGFTPQITKLTDINETFCAKNELLRFCKKPCNFKLECGHNCSGTCGECRQGTFHKRCEEKCNATLICGHSCKINCNQNCLPCKEKCFYRCIHSKCNKNCGAICTECKEPCVIRCPHQKCSKLCGQICDVEPCKEPCPKKLKCSHDCLGFCGDPCPPVCKICDPNDETFEVFLGNEDEPNARFVYLQDCKHTLESTGLDNWFALANDDKQSKVVQYLVCPKCKTRLNLPPRYSNYIKRAYKDIAALKQKHFGTQNDINKEIQKLSTKYSLISHYMRREDLKFTNLIKTVVNLKQFSLKKLNLSLPEVVCYNAMFDLYETFSKCRLGKKSNTLNNSLIETFARFFINSLAKDKELQLITNQQIEDLQLELDRFNRLIQLLEIGNTHLERLHLNCLNAIMSPVRYNKDLDCLIKQYLTELNARITDLERREIVKAIGLKKGHWYKCPNGHFYAIGECGGAMEVATCPECKVKIGGGNHRLLDGNAHAPEMDGSVAAAWSDTANMNNYLFD